METTVKNYGIMRLVEMLGWEIFVPTLFDSVKGTNGKLYICTNDDVWFEISNTAHAEVPIEKSFYASEEEKLSGKETYIAGRIVLFNKEEGGEWELNNLDGSVEDLFLAVDERTKHYGVLHWSIFRDSDRESILIPDLHPLGDGESVQSTDLWIIQHLPMKVLERYI